MNDFQSTIISIQLANDPSKVTKESLREFIKDSTAIEVQELADTLIKGITTHTVENAMHLADLLVYLHGVRFED